MILSNITVPLLGLVDTAVIGHLEHAYYLGGSTVGAMVISVITWLCGFLRMTTTGLAAQAYGKNSQQQGGLVLGRGLIVAIAISALVIVFQVPFIDTAVRLSGGSADVQYYATQYAQIRIWGLPAALANLVILGWLLGNHQAKSVMWILIVTNLINLLLDIVFVVYFDWQVVGIASATLIAEYSALVIGFVVIYMKVGTHFNTLFYRLRTSLFERPALMDYFRLNRDILIRTLSLQTCFVFITFQGARMGDQVVAANAILMNFLLFISFGLDGIANAAEVMVGKAKGERNYDQFQNVVRVSFFWTLIFALLYCFIFYFTGKSLVGLISDIEFVVIYTEQYLVWIVILPIVACWSYLFDGIYIGLTQAKVMRNSMLISTFLCFFPVWWVVQDMENHGLWLALSVFMLARALTLSLHFYRYLWTKSFLQAQ